MKKKRILCYLCTLAITRINLVGCNPFLPGVIAIAGGEELSKGVLMGMLALGCASFMPYITGAKYLLIGGLILLGENVAKSIWGRLSVLGVALITALATLGVGLAGEIMCFSEYGCLTVLMESAFSFGMVLTFKGLLHRFLVEKKKLLQEAPSSPGEGQNRLQGYVRAIEKMAETLGSRQVAYAASEASGSLAVSKGLAAIANALNGCAREPVYECMGQEEEIRQLEYRLSEKGMRTGQYSYCLTEDGRRRLSFWSYGRDGASVSLRQIGNLATDLFGVNLLPGEQSATFVGKNKQYIMLVERGRFQVRFHTARAGMDENGPCGDNFSVIRKEEGRTVLALSDGMGSGLMACRQSETVLELLEELLGAGFLARDALPMMNGCLSATCREGFLATMDLCEVDEFSGQATFYKMGAPASFLIRGEHVECVEGQSLPAGAFVGSSIQTVEKKLYHGDYIVMVSDGVLYGLSKAEPEECFAQLLRAIPKGNPGAMAEAVIEIVKQAGGTLLDDCMVLVAGIFER